MRRTILALLACCALPAQVAEKANEHYRTGEGRADVAKRLSSPDREQTHKPRELVEALGLKPGMTVADLGTGVGFMLPFLSRAVGASGRVLAQDIFEDFLGQARKKAESEKLSNVVFVAGTDKNPNLPDSSVDVVLSLDSYHHFDYPALMLAGISKSLREGGRFVVVDYYKSKFNDPAHIRLEAEDVIQEIEANGFRLAARREHVPGRQYMIEFAKR